jgi:hypothetical protein
MARDFSKESIKEMFGKWTPKELLLLMLAVAELLQEKQG